MPITVLGITAMLYIMCRIGIVVTLLLQMPSPGLAASSRLELPASAVASDFSRLHSQGFSVLPAGYLFPNGEDLRLYETAVRLIRPNPPERGRGYFTRGSGDIAAGTNVAMSLDSVIQHFSSKRGELEPVVADHLKAVVERLGLDLSRICPGEEFYYYDSRVTLAYDGVPAAHTPHVDRGLYFTANYVIGGPGTIIYQPQGKQLRITETPERRLIVISGDQREIFMGITAPVHSAPVVQAQNRLNLQIRYISGPYKSRSEPPAISEKTKEATRQREEEVKQLLGETP